MAINRRIARSAGHSGRYQGVVGGLLHELSELAIVCKPGQQIAFQFFREPPAPVAGKACAPSEVYGS